jgi:MFS family permease
MKFSSKTAYKAIFALGIVSLLGDVVYEGARGIVPDYLSFLGASALVVGLVGGIGEFTGYALRLVSGILADTTRAYWFFTFLGYGLIISIPLLAISGNWQLAIVFVLVERLGKAIRAPSRDVILSLASKGVGTGKAFGVHEFLDQIGAVVGPMLVAALMFFTSNSYNMVFALMFIPFALMLVALVSARKSVGAQINVERKITGKKEGLNKKFYMYVGAVTVNSIGLIPVWLILFKGSAILQPVNMQYLVPVLYVMVQLIDAPVALLSGYAYDRVGMKLLLIPFFVSIFPPIIASAGQDLLALAVSALSFGLVLGMQESIYRAAVADLTPLGSRGKAYGIFNMAYGLGFLISGVIYGAFFDYGVSVLVISIYAILTQAVAIYALVKVNARR